MKPIKATICLFLYLLLAGLSLKANESGKLATNGVLDLSGIDMDNFKVHRLHGEWLFFADTLISPENITEAINTLSYKTIVVPSKRKATNNILYGTYYLKLKLDSTNNLLNINTLTIYSAATIYVNGCLVGEIGRPTQHIETTEPGLFLKSQPFILQKENEIIIQYANFYREKNGLANSIQLVSPKQLIKQAIVRIIKYAIIIGTIIFIIFNQLNYFFIRRKNLTSIFFGLASLSIAIYITFMSIYYWGPFFPNFDPNFNVALRIWRMAYYATVCFFGVYIYFLFKSIYSTIILRLIIIYTTFSALLTLFAPLSVSSVNFNIFMYFTLFVGLHGLLMGILGVIQEIEDAKLFVFGFGFFLVLVINDVLHNLLIIRSVNLLDVGIFGMMLTQAQIINSKLNRSIISNESLTQHLKYINSNLESIVTKRTEEIEEQKTEIEAQRDFAMSQHTLISRQKKTITDSLNYAREIQQAMLSDKDLLNSYFSDSFILFKPKDFVSGDFYWIKHFTKKDNEYMAFCIADCTGHGVPGALLSILGMSLLGEIISNHEISTSAEILEILRNKFKETLFNRLDRQNSGDGMHITLCLVNKTTNQISYSGAFQSLYIIRNNQLTKIKGTNCIIGNYMNEQPFINHPFNLEKNDRLYLFTDGFADQMAGDGQGRFMQKRLLKILTSFDHDPGENQKQRLIQEFEAWKGDFEQIDDVLVMGVIV